MTAGGGGKLGEKEKDPGNGYLEETRFRMDSPSRWKSSVDGRTTFFPLLRKKTVNSVRNNG